MSRRSSREHGRCLRWHVARGTPCKRRIRRGGSHSIGGNGKYGFTYLLDDFVREAKLRQREQNRIQRFSACGAPDGAWHYGKSSLWMCLGSQSEDLSIPHHTLENEKPNGRHDEQPCDASIQGGISITK